MFLDLQVALVDTKMLLVENSRISLFNDLIRLSGFDYRSYILRPLKEFLLVGLKFRFYVFSLMQTVCNLFLILCLMYHSLGGNKRSCSRSRSSTRGGKEATVKEEET